MPINTNLWRAQKVTFGIMIAKLCVMNTWSSITKVKFQNLNSSSPIMLSSLELKKYCHSKFCQIKYQLEAYNTLHSYDLICVSETWLDSTTSTDSNDLFLKSYNLHRVDDPDIVKKEGFVFIKKKPQPFSFYKQS